MPFRVHLIAIALIIAVPLAIFWLDARWNGISYACEAERNFTLGANLPGMIHGADIRLEGSVSSGSVVVVGFPDNDAPNWLDPQTFPAGASVSLSHVGDMYGPVDVSFAPAHGAACDFRVSYRLKSNLSLFNPLW